MTRETHEAGLAPLRDNIVGMTGTALKRYRAALDVPETGDRARAGELIEGDDGINRRYRDIEGDCIEPLALQQSVAGDPRLIVSLFEHVTDTERVGDHMVNICGRTLYRIEHDEGLIY